ncbi:hypothetical protein QTI66_31805 [Variovorax sp. J22R133]|uniref:hypothetical protein n=1 Tax=Variovorax brevis TaxID=3053503 RepID=UPI002574DD7B|nr:hypothetical protein [Variovorax sp. J22R133]MDM0116724.1 hypothetical protein [Variovorax sp. J22R133]
MQVDSQTPTAQIDPFPKDQLDAHRLMVLWLFVVTAAVAALLATAVILADPTLHPGKPDDADRQAPVLLLVAMAGAMGGFVSCLRRLYAFEDIFPRTQYVVLFGTFNPYLIAYSSIPPLIGLIAAVAGYGMFAAGLLQGSTFPAFRCAEGGNGCMTLPTFLGYWRPSGPTDYAKSLVWAFIFGFSERYFVDILNQFGSRARSDRTSA